MSEYPGRDWQGRVFIGVSLDGYIARADGDIDWLTDPPGGREHVRVDSDHPALDWDTFFPEVDHLVMGRGTYEKVLSFGAWPYSGKRVLVLSQALETEDVNVRVVRSVDEAVSALNAEGAESVYVDGGRVIQSFLGAGLIDEITVSWAPVLLGGGLSLFGSLPADVLLTLVGTHTNDAGMVAASYRVHRQA